MFIGYAFHLIRQTVGKETVTADSVTVKACTVSDNADAACMGVDIDDIEGILCRRAGNTYQPCITAYIGR